MVKADRGGVRAFATAIVAAAMCASASAQSNKGKITPVDSDDEAPPKPVLHYYDKHGEKLEEPVLYLAELDTAKNVRPGSPYPLYNGVVVGVNFADAILGLTGQKHSSYDISCAVSIHNWFFPIVEAGIGWGEHTASGDAYHYKAKPAFYAKIGINYNFLYKSKPDYMAYVGLRYGVTSHSWDITDISPTSDLGKETGATELLGQKCTSTYGEVTAGLKVKIAGPFSLGWSIKYRLGLHNSKGMDPWYVPGYGTGGLGVNFSAYFTFGEKPRRDAKPEDATELREIKDGTKEPDTTGAPDTTGTSEKPEGSEKAQATEQTETNGAPDNSGNQQ